MYKLCSTKGSAGRQQVIEECLLELMQIRQYSDISVSELCEKAGIPRKAFYRYFSNKDSALQSLISRVLMGYESFPGTYQPGERRTVRRDFMHMFLYWREQGPFLDAMERSGLTGLLMEQSIRFSLSPEALPKRFLAGDTEEMIPQVTAFAAAGAMSMILAWHRQGYARSVNEQADIALRVLTQPLFPHPETVI